MKGARLAALVVATATLTGCGQGEPVSTQSAGRGDGRRYTGTFLVLESADHGPELCTSARASYPPQCGQVPVSGWDWSQVDDEESAAGTTWGRYTVTGTYDGRRLSLTEPPSAPAQGSESSPAPDQLSPACPEPAVVDPSHGFEEWSEAFAHRPLFDPGTLIAVWVNDPAGGEVEEFIGDVLVRPGAGEQASARARAAGYRGRLCVVEQDSPTEAELLKVQQELHAEEARDGLGAVATSHPDGRKGVVEATLFLVDDEAVDYARSRWGALVELTGLLKPVQPEG